METTTLHWQKCKSYLSLGRWCQLDSDLLDDPRLEIRRGRNLYGFDPRIGITGGYIIWAGIANRTILKVGSGIIKDRLRAHLNDPKVQAYKHRGLYATWASFLFVDKQDDKQRGVERFLGLILNPKIGERFPANVEMVAGNLPEWDKNVNPFLRRINQRWDIPPKVKNIIGGE